MGELGVFIILALVTLIPAVVVVTSHNIVRAALSLVPSFLGVTGLYILLQAEFVAGIQVLIYVGAITVLLLFVIILTLTRTVWPIGAGSPPPYNAVAIGNAFMTDYVLIFEATSLVLLVSLIGAIVTARGEE